MTMMNYYYCKSRSCPVLAAQQRLEPASRGARPVGIINELPPPKRVRAPAIGQQINTSSRRESPKINGSPTGRNWPTIRSPMSLVVPINHRIDFGPASSGYLPTAAGIELHQLFMPSPRDWPGTYHSRRPADTFARSNFPTSAKSWTTFAKLALPQSPSHRAATCLLYGGNGRPFREPVQLLAGRPASGNG